MAENPLMEKADKVIKEGGILARLYFDVHGKTAQGTKELATGFVAGISKEEGVELAVSQIEETTEEEGMFTTYIMSVVAFKDVISFFKFIGKYTPSAVEVLKPSKVELDASDLMEISLFFSEVLFDMKMKLYLHTLSPSEKAAIEKVLKTHSEKGKELLKRGEKSDKDEH